MYLLMALLVAVASDAMAQGTLGTFVRTGSGMSLVTVTQQVDLSFTMRTLMFDFGFATDELPQPGEFLDSFSVTIQNLAGDQTAILVTADASGFVWAPETPGTVPITADSILREPFPFPDAQPTPAQSAAFHVRFDVPEVFQNGSLNVFFDLFDNQNSLASVGYLTVAVVPEPSVWALMLCGAAFAAWRFKRRVR